MTQPAGRVCGQLVAFRFILRASPYIDVSDAISLALRLFIYRSIVLKLPRWERMYSGIKTACSVTLGYLRWLNSRNGDQNPLVWRHPYYQLIRVGIPLPLRCLRGGLLVYSDKAFHCRLPSG